MIAHVLTRPSLTRAALHLARLFSPFVFLLPNSLRAMAKRGGALKSSAAPYEKVADVQSSHRIFSLPGCVQQVIAPEIDAAMARILARRGISLVPLPGAGCCGALSHHLGREEEAKAFAKHNIEAFEQAGGERADGVAISATGCAAHIADYGHLFLDDPDWRARAKAVTGKLLAMTDLLSSPVYGGGGSPRSGETEGGDNAASPPSASLALLARHLPRKRGRKALADEMPSLRVAYHVPCSQQHGLRQADDGEVLRAAGYDVVAIPEGHLCCGSAGSYSLLQPDIAAALRERKLVNIRPLQADVIATSNIGCLQHLSGADAPPVIHIAELLDWAEGGPAPHALPSRAVEMTQRTL
jgi:glycolate oxidase iron-sulfur subunit